MLSLLRMRLHHAIAFWRACEAGRAANHASPSSEACATNDLTLQAIPIKRVGNATSMLYASAIAHQLAASPNQTATIAAQLVDTLNQDLTDHQKPLGQGITVHATATGFIQFAVSDRAIATWLDLLLANKLPQPSLPTIPVSEAERQRILQAPALFEVQHAHARCCSLLRLAHREGFIHLEKLEALPQDWQFSSSTAPVWLALSARLCFQHPADRALLAQLFDAYDHLGSSQPQTQAAVLRSAQAVAHAFQTFHRVHPLWERAQEDSTISVARLGLLMITQRVLHVLLWDGLNLYPILEL